MLKLADSQHRSGGCHGWILYTHPESERNRRYIDFYKAACRKYGMSIELGIWENTEQSWTESGRQQLCQLVKQEQPAFAVNRTRDYRLAKLLEKLGVRVYNNSRIAELGNNKAKACRYMEQCGIPIMPAVYGIGKSSAIEMDFPFVVKSCCGHGGTEVFLINNTEEWENWKCCSFRQGTEYMIQQPASDLGRDVRVYVVGNRITASVLRISRTDFRSNSCLGGMAQLYRLSDTERRLAEQIISHFQIGMAGIDFIFHHGQMIFNEMEDMAGARNLYALTNYDIVDEYVRYIQKDL